MVSSFIQPSTYVCIHQPIYSSFICSATHPFYPFITQFLHPSSYVSLHPSTIHACVHLCIHLSIYSLIYSPSLIHLAAIHPSMLYLCIHLYDYLCIIHPPCHACIHWLIYTLPISPFRHPSVFPCILPSTNLSIHLPKHHHSSIFPVIFSNQPTMQ